MNAENTVPSTRQSILENRSIELGVARYQKDRPLPWRTDKSKRKEEADLEPGKALVKRTLGPFTEEVVDLVESVRTGKAGRGRPSIAVKYISQFDPEVVAFVAARRVLNGASVKEPMTAMALGIATLMEDHYRFEQFAKIDPGLYRLTTAKLKKTTHQRHRRGVMNHALKLTSVKGLEWTLEDKLHTGLKLIELFVARTGLAETHTERRGLKTKEHVQFTAATVEWLERQHRDCALLSPLYIPMVERPRVWTNPLDGGYNDPRLRLTLVKTKRRTTVDELFSTCMPEVYATVNTLQSTPWRINKGLYAVVSEAWAASLMIAGLPGREPAPLPARPAHIPADVPLKDLPPEAQKLIKEYVANSAKIHADNALRTGQRYGVLQQLWVADTFKDEPEIYFPYTLDFRGRIYPVPVGVNPQADDLGRSLIEFAQGKPLGESGGFWLAVQLANTFGFDKVTFNERVDWVQQNQAAILDSALRPLDGERFWLSADSPWQFLAACLEWTGFLMCGNDYVSHLPVHMDGTCSGLQHFSAMLKDPVGAAEVNLIPGTKKADVYMAVANKVELELTGLDDVVARAWRGKVSRQMVKQPTMTFAYSATERGMRDQIVKALENADREGKYLGGVRYWDGAGYLAPKVRQAISHTVVAAARAMDWLQEAVKVAAKNNLPVRWTSPVGLPVLQDARKVKAKRVKANFAGRVIKLTLSIELSQIDSKAQAFGIAPNFVHSLDAAHLMRTVQTCKASGIDSFAMIHDSFGVHACDVDTLHAVTREEFIELYSTDRLKEFRDELASQLPPELVDELPPLPATGDLDLLLIRDSQFFFA